MFFAIRAILSFTASDEWQARLGHLQLPGKPKMSMASLIVIIILIALRLAGLSLVTRLMCLVWTWASAFDALQAAQIGKVLPIDGWPPIVEVTPGDEMRVRDIDALIGRAVLSLGPCRFEAYQMPSFNQRWIFTIFITHVEPFRLGARITESRTCEIFSSFMFLQV
ncbi:hypothetical protein RRF57_003183 [Xylaria bambusicola]|uniref:Uncharacterized protein n=1 Tax=Xylaria bambusicola TaxID=326684 RepID=A0AAN7UFT9_9PEZI